MTNTIPPKIWGKTKYKSQDNTKPNKFIKSNAFMKMLDKYKCFVS